MHIRIPLDFGWAMHCCWANLSDAKPLEYLSNRFGQIGLSILCMDEAISDTRPWLSPSFSSWLGFVQQLNFSGQQLNFVQLRTYWLQFHVRFSRARTLERSRECLAIEDVNVCVCVCSLWGRYLRFQQCPYAHTLDVPHWKKTNKNGLVHP